ncbi:fructokinase [Filimonas lacunae]|uniref:Fructokinase n=1 Tax=Filimonas lacunae TaxID=477680 RepID=A0A173MHV7_9BACT|nr:sugar kinase [Filimonas lacunae]BAV07066.1 fructokinase [Filimonas lacunae]SIS95468.1 fructokinase [Filimonas lacunae]
MKSYILAIGELLVDAISTTTVNSLSEAKAFTIVAGGSPANFCRFLNYCQTPSRLVAAVGEDGLGAQLLQQLKQEGMDTRYISRNKNLATSLIVVGKTIGTPDFIPYREADRFITPVSSSLLSGAALVHTTAFALSAEPARKVILNAFAAAATSGIPVSIDWNYAEKIWGPYNDAPAIWNELQQYAPLIKISMDDIQRFEGRELTESEARCRLDKIRCRAICLTCGANGVYYRVSEGDWQHMPAKPVAVKDATGAGDAFWAGFISAWFQEFTIEACVAKGMDSAVCKLSGQW